MENIIESTTGSLDIPKAKDLENVRDGHLDQPISVLMEQDVWVRAFIHECCLVFGAPCVSSVCLSKADRFLYTFALISVSTSMRRLSSVWKGLYKKVEPKDAAWEFCRRYYEKFNTMVIPDASDGPTIASKVIPKLIKKKSVKD